MPLASMAEERRMGKNASRTVSAPVGSIERMVSMWRLNVSPEYLIPCGENAELETILRRPKQSTGKYVSSEFLKEPSISMRRNKK